MAPLACMLCSIDPATANLLLPMAQATVITAPILLRDHVRRGARAVVGRLHPAPTRNDPPVRDPNDPELADADPA